jgi:hypothetical protein
VTAFPKPVKPEEDARLKRLWNPAARPEPIRPRCTCKHTWKRHEHGECDHSRQSCADIGCEAQRCKVKGCACTSYRAQRPPPKNKLPRGHRKSDLGKAKRTLWDDWFAPYIKARDGNVCFTCGQVVTGGDLQAGHMFPGRTGALLFDPLVVKSQCSDCNRGKRGCTAVFIARYIALHGTGQFEVVVARTSRDMQWRTHEIRELIEALKRERDEPGYYESFYEARYGLSKEAVDAQAAGRPEGEEGEAGAVARARDGRGEGDHGEAPPGGQSEVEAG